MNERILSDTIASLETARRQANEGSLFLAASTLYAAADAMHALALAKLHEVQRADAGLPPCAVCDGGQP